MNNPERNNMRSKRLCFSVICLILYLVKITKIAPGTCENFTSSIISRNGVSNTIATFPITDLESFPGTPNFVYQKNIKNCSKVNQFVVNDVFFNETIAFKPPPLVATLIRMPKNKELRKLKGTNISANPTKPLTFVLCGDNFDILQLVEFNEYIDEKSPPYLDFSTYLGKRKTQVIKKVAFEFAIMSILQFHYSPACVLVDNLKHKVFWSDSKKGIIESYDSQKNEVNILVDFLTKPGSMVIDLTRELLFWCNVESVGSIERINFDGSNREKITKGKYDLHYPDMLEIDHTHQMIYWTAEKVIHRSDYNGNFHKIIKKSKFNDSNFPRCISFTKAFEHNFFLEKPLVPYYNRSFSPNYLLSIYYNENSDQILQQNHWSTSHVCQEIPSGYHCFLLPVSLDRIMYIKVKHMLSISRYKPKMLNQLRKLNPKHEKLLLNVESFFFNSKSYSVFYYDSVLKNIRYISFLKEHPIDIVKNIIVPIKGFGYNGLNNNIYFINASENSIIMAKLDKNYYPKTMRTIRKNMIKNIFVALIIDVQNNSLLFYPAKYLDYNDMHQYTKDDIYTFTIQNVNMSTLDSEVTISKMHTMYLLNVTTNSVDQLKLHRTNNIRLQSHSTFSFKTKYKNYTNNAQTQIRGIYIYIFQTIFNLVIGILA
ncbi:uncharacterized protein LOC112595126 [Melanaphis sacchari]|uniref:uncharacterized protein LOC112595126 n=1 Tax=Melanaphis sacchari TaxID=742174 RepID=UPI000DC1488C|nr:uncharacterized protein LOC112595126 [Melanaphis sacchari]